MLKLRIKVTGEDKTYSERHLMDDDFEVSKSNLTLVAMVKQACDNSHIDEKEDVIVYSQSDW